MSEKILSKIIARKTGFYLKISMILFVLSLILLSTALIFIQQQYIQLKKDFIDNENTHLITILSKNDNSNQASRLPLTFTDEDQIKTLIESNMESYVYSDYSINFGMGDSEGNVYFIKGIDNAIISKFGLSEIKDNEALSNPDMEVKEVILKIPYISIESGGFTSNSVTDMKFKLYPAIKNAAPIDIFDMKPDTIFVNTNTMKNIINSMYHITWEEFIKSYNKGEGFGLNLIEKINIYVENLNEVENAAKILENNRYEVSYVLGAFEDLQASLNNTYFIYGLLILFVLFITAVNIIISFRSYLYNMQKDMGIFCHYGYSKLRVYLIYKGLIVRPYLRVVGLIIVYTLIISILFLKWEFLQTFAITTSLIIAFISIILILLLIILRNITKKPVIELLKTSKEIE